MEQNLFKRSVLSADLLFPVDIKTILKKSDDPDLFYCNWHEELEIIVVTKGTGVFQVDSMQYKLLQGEWLLIPPNRLHRMIAGFGTCFDFFIVIVRPDFLYQNQPVWMKEKFFDPFLQEAFPIHGIQQRESKSLFLLLCEFQDFLLYKQGGWELLVQCRLTELWHELYCAYFEKPQKQLLANPKIDGIKNVILYIENHYNEKITLRDLADQIAMSEGQLCRFFKAVVHIAPFEYLNYYRICKSAQMLKMSSKRVTEIAMDTGYQNISYFNRTFQRFMHCSPLHFRSHGKGTGSLDSNCELS